MRAGGLGGGAVVVGGAGLEATGDSFQTFGDNCVKATRRHPTPELLVRSVRGRMLQLCAQKRGCVTNTPDPE